LSARPGAALGAGLLAGPPPVGLPCGPEAHGRAGLGAGRFRSAGSDASVARRWPRSMPAAPALPGRARSARPPWPPVRGGGHKTLRKVCRRSKTPGARTPRWASPADRVVGASAALPV